jgi:curved DNA-binding protein CbpA
MKNYYEILNVESKASKAEIKKTYIMLAKRYHPDKVNQDGGEDTGMFADISEAYEVLSDEKKREEYDSNLKKFNEGIDVEQKKMDEKFEHYFIRAKKRIKEHRYLEALEYYERLENNYKYTNKQPSQEFYSYFGYALFMSGKDKKRGIDLMDKAVTQSMFSDEDFMLNLAEAYFMNNEKNKAQELIKQTFSVNPRSKRAYLMRQKYVPKKKGLLDMIFRRK